MNIISLDNSYSMKDQPASGPKLPTGTLYFATKDEANNYSDIAGWGNGTVCYTKNMDVGVLDNGTWTWQ